MAARGEAGEKDLAGLAEKVRSAAERFGRLGRELEEIARTVSEQSRSTAAPGGEPVVSGADPETGRLIMEISGRIESRSRSLQKKLTVLGNDVKDMERTLRMDAAVEEDLGDQPVDPAQGRERNIDGSIVNFGAGGKEPGVDEGIDDSDLVIDHGKLWEAPEKSSAELTDEEPAGIEGIEVTDDSGEFLIAGFQEAMSAMHDDASGQSETGEPEEAAGDTVTGEALPETHHEHMEEPSAEKPETEEPGMEEPAEPAAEAVPSKVDEWSEVQQGGGNDWMKVEVEQPGGAGVAGPEVVPVQEASAVEPEIVPEVACTDDPAVEAVHIREPESAAAPEPEADAAVPGQQEEEASDTGEEQVYDLFELGAVEYSEEAEVNL